MTSTVVRKIGEMPLVPATIGAMLTKGTKGLACVPIHRATLFTPDILDDRRLDAFGQHFHAFLGVGAEAARRVEAAMVVDHDRRLTDFEDIVDRLGEGFLSGFLAHDDLDQTHPLNR